jgi:gliding motility-associated-like protein
MAVKVDIGYFDKVVTWEGDTITYQYQWDGNPQQFKDTLTQVSAGYHYVKVRDSFGCENVFDSVMPALTNILVSTYMDPGFFDTATYFCPNDTVKLYTGVIILEDGAAFRDSIVWEAWDTNNELVFENINKDTLYSATNQSLNFVAMAYYGGCAAPDSLFAGRYKIDKLIASVDGDKEKIFLGNEIVLRGNELEVTYPDGLIDFDVTHSWTWTADNGGVIWNPSPPDTIAPMAKPSVNTLFTVYDTIRIVNLNYSNQVCLLSDTLHIIVLPEFDPPAGFTPNGDGLFDKWDLPGIQGYTNVDIQIFNRWGGLVWEHSGAYEGNEWEGTNTKGKSLPSGTYYYIIKYGDDTGTKTTTGPVTILR